MRLLGDEKALRDDIVMQWMNDAERRHGDWKIKKVIHTSTLIYSGHTSGSKVGRRDPNTSAYPGSAMTLTVTLAVGGSLSSSRVLSRSSPSTHFRLI
jgi:hypothetical protein